MFEIDRYNCLTLQVFDVKYKNTIINHCEWVKYWFNVEYISSAKRKRGILLSQYRSDKFELVFKDTYEISYYTKC